MRLARSTDVDAWRITRRLSILLLALSCSPAGAYSVQTHEQLIDLSWESAIAPILRTRFPPLTPQQLERAHAAAYGGCAIQDLGYYPFGRQFFSDLTHYIRSGDFIESLFRNARTADELAFAIGALTHYIGDIIGHSYAINRSVATEFPDLRARYGPSVSYAQDKHAHVQVEFAFDVNQVAKQRMAPSVYLRKIGLNVPRRQLAAAFHETYGLNIGDVTGLYRPTLRTYRFGVRTFVPAFSRAEALLHRGRFPPDPPGPEFDQYQRRIVKLSAEAGWQRYRRGPRICTYLLAAFIVIVPKIGPMAMLAIKGPTPATEELYIESVNRATAAFHTALDRMLAAGAAGHIRLSDLVPNRDLDTGAPVIPGGYRLTDQTYFRLLDRITKDPARPIPASLKRDVLRYYADPGAPIATKRDPKKWARVQEELRILATIPERPEPE